MRLSSINTYNNNNPSMQAYKYRPNRTPFYINPIKQQVDKLFEHSIAVSKRQRTVSDKLKPYLSEVPIRTNKVDTYAFDMTKNGGKGKYVLFLHGLGQNIAAEQGLYNAILENTEYSVFVPEYRGFGKNPLKVISNETFLEDTQAALDYLVNEKQIPENDITVVGHSFGGFVASQLVKANPNLNRLILVSSVDNLGNEMMRSSAMKHVSPIALKILKNIRLLRKYLESLFSTKDQLQTSNIPVDIIHSMNDRVVSYKSAKYLSEYCQNLRSVTFLKTGGHSMEENKINTVINLLR